MLIKLRNEQSCWGIWLSYSAISFLSGVIMVMLGMIGEYVGRIYISINESPQYVVREMINIEKSSNEQLNG